MGQHRKNIVIRLSWVCFYFHTKGICANSLICAKEKVWQGFTAHIFRSSEISTFTRQTCCFYLKVSGNRHCLATTEFRTFGRSCVEIGMRWGLWWVKGAVKSRAIMLTTKVF